MSWMTAPGNVASSCHGLALERTASWARGEDEFAGRAAALSWEEPITGSRLETCCTSSAAEEDIARLRIIAERMTLHQPVFMECASKGRVRMNAGGFYHEK